MNGGQGVAGSGCGGAKGTPLGKSVIGTGCCDVTSGHGLARDGTGSHQAVARGSYRKA